MEIKANGITLESFVKEYSNRATDKLKDDYIRDNLKVTSYISFLMKNATASNLVKQTVYKKVNGEQTDDIQFNSPARYLLFTLHIIDLYTNIIVDFTKVIEEYDLLAENGLIQMIMSKIPESEITEFNTIVQMVLDDIMQNEFTIQAFVHKEITRISDLVSVLAPVLSPIIDKVGEGITANIDNEN